MRISRVSLLCRFSSCLRAGGRSRGGLQQLGGVKRNRFKEWVPQSILVREQTHQEELGTPDGRSGKIRSRLSSKVSEEPSTSRLHLCRLFVLFLLKKFRSQLRSLHPKYSLIRRHCTIAFFFSTLLIVICTNDAHHAEGHDLHQDLCRRSSLPHHRFKSQEIF